VVMVAHRTCRHVLSPCFADINATTSQSSHRVLDLASTESLAEMCRIVLIAFLLHTIEKHLL
jgi:hypothetical protein